MAQDAWQKSSFSGGGDSDDCVEVSARQDTLLVRESEEPGTVVETTGPGLAALIRAIRAPRYCSIPRTASPSTAIESAVVTPLDEPRRTIEPFSPSTYRSALASRLVSRRRIVWPK